MNHAKRYLVTGGCGFIGAGIVRDLVAWGKKVIVADHPDASLWRLADLNGLFEYYSTDLSDTLACKQLIYQVKPTHIYHCAAYGVIPSQTLTSLIYQVNFEGTKALVEAAVENGFEFFLHCGSSSEYGKRDVCLSESIALEPCSDYALSKAYATQFCLKIAQEKKLALYTVRPFSVYGPQEMSGRFMTELMRGALSGESVSLSQPHYVRDFIYRDDFLAVCYALEVQRPTQYYIFNAGTGIQTSLGDVVAILQNISPRGLSVVWDKSQPRPWEPLRWQSDQTRTQSILGVTPRYSLHEGLLKMLDWTSRNLNSST